ncbi:MAG: hypothetical protein C0620_06355 [Desulfuromonas sp.]|nr:MAG: hypothetical protein C0620_06355 [Desulfuromonas sp.]
MEKMMKILVSIDDTDNLESCGTGELAAQISQTIEEEGWGHCSYITRHQLLVHPDVPYTSHNSAMCFEATIEPENLGAIIDWSSQFLANNSAEGSDPGLCVAVVDALADIESLIAYGQSAKLEVLNKALAYQRAVENGLHLSEHGGTGQGVIGALAGIGLRLGGMDGRLKGKVAFSDDRVTFTAEELKDHPWIDAVETEEGDVVADATEVMLVDKVKVVRLRHHAVLLVEQNEQGQWQVLSRQKLKKY